MELTHATPALTAGRLCQTRYGTGGNNVPLIAQETAPSQEPAHAMFSRQRVDVFREDAVASTQSARAAQGRDRLGNGCGWVGLQGMAGKMAICEFTLQQGTTGSSLNSIHPVRTGQFIRRLTPLECERLQGFPDHWTDFARRRLGSLQGAGNSVAIPAWTLSCGGFWVFRQNKEA